MVPSRSANSVDCLFFFSSRRRHTRSVSAFLLNRSSDLSFRNRLLVIIMVANKYAFLQITRRRFLNEWEAFKKVISRRKIGRASCREEGRCECQREEAKQER